MYFCSHFLDVNDIFQELYGMDAHIYKTLTSQMAGFLEAGVSDVIFNSVVPVVVTSHVDLHMYLFSVVVSMVTLLHFLYFPTT